MGGALDDSNVDGLMELLTDDDDDHGYDDDYDADGDDGVDEVTRETLPDQVVDDSTGEDDRTVAVLVRQSLRRYPSTMYVGLHENHFFYIKDHNAFVKSYRCSRWSKLWKTAWDQQRHERTCNQQVRYTF